MNKPCTSVHDVVVVGARAAGAATAMLLARAGLDEHIDAVPFELADTIRCHRNPVLSGLDLLRHAEGPDDCGRHCHGVSVGAHRSVDDLLHLRA